MSKRPDFQAIGKSPSAYARERGASSETVRRAERVERMEVEHMEIERRRAREVARRESMQRW
jgi:hypothetical protein